MPRFDAVTEQWGEPMSARQLDMAHTRYRLALDHAAGKNVLEVACGSGFGMALLARVAGTVVGGDVDDANAHNARARTGLPIARLDAQRLPFRDGSFDLVLLFESIYYLRDPAAALGHIRRVLRPRGTLLVCLPNRERAGFHPSPLASAYHTAAELRQALTGAGFSAEVLGGYRTEQRGPFPAIATLAARLHIIPRTLKGRARIKRLLYGRLERFEGLRPDRDPEPLHRLDANGPVREWTNLYAIATRE